MARRYDPERRERIIDAAIRIVELKGIGALSHRTVAAEAGVPLGSTTYHFAGLDDLLVASLEQVCGGPRGAMKDWEEVLAAQAQPVAQGSAAEGPGPQKRRPLADVLTDLMEEYAHGGRGRIRLEYELYLAALRRPALQPVAAAWLDEMVEVIGRHTADVATARVLVALIDGLLLQLLLTDRPFDRRAVRSTLARVTGET
ncbi:TetR/AcrR family transcriptional regulator [Streptomyces sp. WMMB 322]|uniref:TetR/AcrR family transcriptional regulator n=1 Tax=Streptomyces sp. WMMB 322 TaxID=1286821 RepID=UPI0008238DDC|nr:TetR family transcriptional regulator [Streptomyces sp. WMMB 322]SCK22766.1 transcriptional regulator, TetR family [Streptomyces sp. WMMB 322]